MIPDSEYNVGCLEPGRLPAGSEEACSSNDQLRPGVQNRFTALQVADRLMNTVEALDHAIAAHAKWKYRLLDAIDTRRSESSVSDVRSDHACEFGKWLFALPLSERLSVHCQKVRTLHAEFHSMAADVLELALAGCKDEARSALGFGSRFASVSANLTVAVNAWKDDVLRDQTRVTARE